MQQLHKEGVFSDLSKINTLLGQANKYVITDSGWNLLDFAAQMRGLTSGNLVFHTLPIKGYATIDNQDANVIDPSYIKSIIKAAFYPKPAAPRQHKHSAPASPDKSITVDVLNGGYTAGLAGQVQSALVKQGYQAGKLGNTASRTSTVVRYGAGAAGNASKIASVFGTKASQSTSVAANHVEIMLGSSATSMPSGLDGSPQPHSSSVAIPTKGPQGGAVHAGHRGIPCVN
jgi:hypothetical protein